MNKLEQELVFQILDEVGDGYGRSGCNDFSMPATPESLIFLQNVIKYNYKPEDRAEHLQYLIEEYPSGRLSSIDSAVLSYLRDQLQQLFNAQKDANNE